MMAAIENVDSDSGVHYDVKLPIILGPSLALVDPTCQLHGLPDNPVY